MSTQGSTGDSVGELVVGPAVGAIVGPAVGVMVGEDVGSSSSLPS